MSNFNRQAAAHSRVEEARNLANAAVEELIETAQSFIDKNPRLTLEYLIAGQSNDLTAAFRLNNGAKRLAAAIDADNLPNIEHGIALDAAMDHAANKGATITTAYTRGGNTRITLKP